MRLINDLVKLSHLFGSDCDYVRAGGGNISVKENGILRIKPSGVSLARLAADDLVPLRISALLDAIETDPRGEGDPVQLAATAARVGPDDGRRPSVEILFHALIPDALVLHLHPLVANAVTCNEHDRELANELLGDEIVLVGYTDPGVPLARAIKEARRAYTERTGSLPPAITLLANHGIIVSGSDADSIAERVRWLTSRIAEKLDDCCEVVPPQPSDKELADTFANALGLIPALSSAVADPIAVSFLTQKGPLIPDQVVYAGSFPILLGTDVASVLAAYRAQWNCEPQAGVLPDGVVVGFGTTEEAARNAAGTLADAIAIASAANQLGKVRHLGETQRRFIETWEAESYRRAMVDVLATSDGCKTT